MSGRGWPGPLTWVIVVAWMASVAVGCAGASANHQGDFKAPEVLPETPPEDLNEEAAAPSLRRGSDGFWYVVGGLGQQVEAGSVFLARYSGEWPLRDLPRPPLAAGRVVERYNDRTALVQLTYWLPDADLASLEVTWEETPLAETLGKGVGIVREAPVAGSSDLTLSLGSDDSVQTGDIYAILRNPEWGKQASHYQLSNRLAGVCMVRQVQAEQATCRLWRGHPVHGPAAEIEADQEIVFLEHTFGNSPTEAVIQIAAVPGSPEVQERLVTSFQSYLDKVPSAHARVTAIDAALDATDVGFHRQMGNLDYLGQPQIVVGASIEERDGRRHLIVNYSGVGPATGPGMVAAPPEGGVDLGPVDSLKDEQLRSLSAVVWAAALVYRGQTSEALMQLDRVLEDKAVVGPLHWHARDQYAMRWGALRYYEEALWLVLEDEAVARKRDDQRAFLNALGTRVRLYDFLELPERAYETARTYLDLRDEDRPNASYQSALGMFAEMAMGAAREKEAREAMAELRKLCPDGCEGDLTAFLSGIFWATTPEQNRFQDEVLSAIVHHTSRDDAPQMAAARVYQGMTLMRDQNLEQAMMAFLEAERLYEEANYPHGVARTNYFMFLVQLGRDEPQEAFIHAQRAIELNQELGDFEAVARTYERMTNLYADIDLERPPGPYLREAQEVLSKAIEVQLARGDYGRAAEAMMALGNFMLQIGGLSESQTMFQQTVWYGLRSARFDVVALSHLYLGIIARAQGDVQTFRDEIGRARLMAEVSGDAAIIELIERALNPPQDDEPPTQLL